MKTSFIRCLLCALSFIPVFVFAQESKKRLNNLILPMSDGCVERFMGYYYAMGTRTRGNIYQSKNMVNWTGPTLAAETNKATWLNDPQWTQSHEYRFVPAGDIVYRNGVFHIYFNGIGHSYSDLPSGMYTEHSINEPFDDFGIDVQLFQDEDGELYYVKKVNPSDPHPIRGGDYGSNGAKIWTFHMESPFVRKGIPGSEQMTHQVGHPTNIDWINFEGPELFNYRDNYYMMFSPNRMAARTGMYLVGVAQSDGPMNFSNDKKYPHPVLMRNMENHHFIYKQILNSGEHGPWNAKYRTTAPTGDWTSLMYDDAGWNTGSGGFGLKTMDRAVIRGNRTIWSTDEIYIRRKFNLEEVPDKLALKYRVEANTDFYINGNKYTVTRKDSAYSLVNINPSWFKKGENIIAVKASNTCSGNRCFKFVDFGLFDTKGQDAENIVIGQSQSNYVVGPGGFERWIMYKGYFNGTYSQGIDRMHFYDKELVIESSSTINSPGYHPTPSMPQDINYFDYSIHYPFEYLNGSEWVINSGVLRPKNNADSELLLRADPMTNYRYEVPFRLQPANNDYMAVYAYYKDENNWLKIKIDRDTETWEYEVNENGILSKQAQELPQKFKFLEEHELVSHYDAPWHTLTIYKNTGKFKVELDYFNLTLDRWIQTNFNESGRIGLMASSTNVNFDAIQYTNGWDEWDNNIVGWETPTGVWQISENGLQQTATTGRSLTTKGDKNFDYEFSVYVKNDKLPEAGKIGFYPLYVDENNYVEVGVNYQTGKLDIMKKTNGSKENQELSLDNKIYRQYTPGSYPTNIYRYDLRSETEISGVNIMWFEGNYPYLDQTFDLPTTVVFYALSDDGSWTQVTSQKLEGELRFAEFNKFTFDKVKTKAIRMYVVPKNGKACRAFATYFNEDLSSGYYLRGRRENDRLYVYVNDSLKASLDVSFDKSNVGLFTENATADFNGLLAYQTGKISVSKITIPSFECDVNQTVELVANVEPLNATNKNLVWVSSDTSIASIDKNNRLTRHKEGEVTITAWTADGGIVKGIAKIGDFTGISQLNKPAILIYPNPAKDKLFIEASEPIKKVEFFSLCGNKILEKSMTSQVEELDINNLVEGIYVLFAQTENNAILSKFIKMN